MELDEGLHEVVALAFAAGPLLTLVLSRDGPHVAIDIDVEERDDQVQVRSTSSAKLGMK